MIRTKVFAMLMSAVLSTSLIGCFISGSVSRADTTGGTVNMYRLYNPNSGEHFYTADMNERNMLFNAGWYYEGIGWVAPRTSNTPVYRLYNENGGEHHYTTSVAERDMLVSLGWNDEGIGWYSDDAHTVPLYRQYNPNAFANNHNYTTAISENDWLVSLGWQAEGIGWYGVAVGQVGANWDEGIIPFWYSYSDGVGYAMERGEYSTSETIIEYTGQVIDKASFATFPVYYEVLYSPDGNFNNADFRYGATITPSLYSNGYFYEFQYQSSNALEPGYYYIIGYDTNGYSLLFSVVAFVR